jgi:hypothetical protein
MTSRAILFLLLLVASTAWAQPEPQAAISLEQRVARLGSKGNSDIQDVQELSANPAASSRLLIAGLHVIPDSAKNARADAPTTEHVLWMIRGLRYVTGGLDFCAESKHVFGTSEEEKNRQYWLTFHHKECLTFFGYWMSRDRIYVAPPDAQRSIISQWQHWYATTGKTFEYKPLQNPPPEKWLW